MISVVDCCVDYVFFCVRVKLVIKCRMCSCVSIGCGLGVSYICFVVKLFGVSFKVCDGCFGWYL